MAAALGQQDNLNSAMTTGYRSSLFELPAELIAKIFSYLPPDSLSALGAAHPHLNFILKDDSLWRQSVVHEFANKSSFQFCEVTSQDCGPTKSGMIMDASGAALLRESPQPYESYRELYFQVLKRHGALIGTWAGNTRWAGSVLEVFYSHWSGKIEGRKIQLDAIVGPTKSFSLDPEVAWRDLNPILQAWVEPLFELGPTSQKSDFMAKVVKLAGTSDARTEFQAAQEHFWPPVNVPVPNRLRLDEWNCIVESDHASTAPSNNLISISRPVLQVAFEADPFFDDFDNIPRQVEFFYRLPQDLPVPPSFDKFSGLFMGDYSAHGGELLYIYYPSPTTLHAVKITGDPNIPRGELSWVVDNIAAPVRTCEEHEWPGARAYAGRGQVSPHGFSNPTWIDAEVILYHTRSDRVAHSLQTDVDPAELDRIHAEQNDLLPAVRPDSARRFYESGNNSSSNFSSTASDTRVGGSIPSVSLAKSVLGRLQVDSASIAVWWKDMAHMSQFHKVLGVSDHQKRLLESMLDRYLSDESDE